MAKRKEIKVVNYITLRDPINGDSETVRMDALTTQEKQRIGALLNKQSMEALGYELVNKEDIPELTDEEKALWKKRFKEISEQEKTAVWPPRNGGQAC